MILGEIYKMKKPHPHPPLPKGEPHAKSATPPQTPSCHGRLIWGITLFNGDEGEGRGREPSPYYGYFMPK